MKYNSKLTYKENMLHSIQPPTTSSSISSQPQSQTNSHPNSPSHSHPPSKKFQTSYVFNTPQNRIWHLLNEPKNITTIFSKTSLSQILPSLPHIYTLTKHSIETTSKKLSYLIHSQHPPPSNSISVSFTFISNTLDQTTLLDLCISTTSLSSNTFSIYKDICYQILNNIEDLIINDTTFLFEYESIEINVPIDIVWNYMTMFKFLEFIHAKDVIFEGEEFGKGMKVHWIYNKGEQDECGVCVVNDVKRDLKRKKWYFVIEPRLENEKKQEIKFTFMKIEEESTFFSYFHQFKENICNEQINLLMDQKKLFLKGMKECLEKSYAEAKKVDEIKGNGKCQEIFVGNGNMVY